MKKILLAVGERNLEKYLENKLDDRFQFVGALVHKDNLLEAVEDKQPDILVIRETLPGKLDLLTAIHFLSGQYPHLRIVFLAKKRPIGDRVLASLVSFKVYDILSGGKIDVHAIIDLILNPNEYVDVQHYLPKPVYDEETDKILFTAPDIDVQPKVITVEKGSENNEINNMLFTNELGGTEDNNNDYVGEKSGEKKNLGEDIGEFIGKVMHANQKTQHPNKQPEIKNEPFTQQATNIIIKGQQGQKIVTFVGGKHGVGTTTVAINVATKLAESGKKVIFLELEDRAPSASYWYQLGYRNKGIDVALTDINNRSYGTISESIVMGRNIPKVGKGFAAKSFPETLDFMFFSQEYLAGITEKQNLSNPKDLYLHLLLHLNYDYVIIDASCDITKEKTLDAILYSSMIFTVITQDIASVAYQYFNLHSLENQGINISDKNNYIVNNYVDAGFGANEISSWLEVNNLMLMPYEGEIFIDANYNGLPAVINGCGNNVGNSINKIVSKILK